jgi:hypothetical protein
MCSPQSAENGETYEIRFDKLPTLPGMVVEHLMVWRGEVCYRHAELIRVALEAGPPVEGDHARSPAATCIEKDAASLDVLAINMAAALAAGSMCSPSWMHGESERLRMIAARMRDYR